MFQQTPTCTYTNKWWWTASVVGYLCWLHGKAPQFPLKTCLCVFLYMFFCMCSFWRVCSMSWTRVPEAECRKSNAWLTFYNGWDHRIYKSILTPHAPEILVETSFLLYVCLCLCVQVCVLVYLMFMNKLCFSMLNVLYLPLNDGCRFCPCCCYSGFGLRVLHADVLV